MRGDSDPSYQLPFCLDETQSNRQGGWEDEARETV